MYITDRKTKQCVASYIKHTYDVNLELNRIYVFKFDYYYTDQPCNEYTIRKYNGYISRPFPEAISGVEIDKWGMVLSRKDKIEKIRKKI